MTEPTLRSGLDDPALRLLVAVVGGDEAAMPEDPLVIEHMMDLASAHRVDGLVNTSSSNSKLTVDQRASLIGHQLRAECKRETVDAEVASLLSVLRELGIEAMILKGWWTSRQVYTHAAQRRFSDIDIWLKPSSELSIGTAAALINPKRHVDIGAVDEALESGLIHNVGVVFQGQMVEIHKNPYGLKVDPSDLGALWDQHAREVEYRGHSLHEPTVELALAVGCVNYTRDCFRQLYQLVDLLRLVECGEVDWDIFWTLCRDQGIESYVHGALSLVSRVFERKLPPGVVELKGWRAWWSSDARVLKAEFTRSERVPAILLMPGGLRSSLRVLRVWIAPPQSVLPISQRQFQLSTESGYARSILALNTARLKQWRARY